MNVRDVLIQKILGLVGEAMIAGYVKNTLPRLNLIINNVGSLTQNISELIEMLAGQTNEVEVKNKGIFVEDFKNLIKKETFYIQQIVFKSITNLNEDELINIINNEDKFKQKIEDFLKKLKMESVQ